MKINRLIGKDLDTVLKELYVLLAKHPTNFNLKKLIEHLTYVDTKGKSMFLQKRIEGAIHRLKTIDRDDPGQADKRDVIRDAINLVESNSNLYWSSK